MANQSVLDIILGLKKTGTADKDVSESLDKTHKRTQTSSKSAQMFTKAWKAAGAAVTIAGAALLKNIPALVEQGVAIKQARVALEGFAGGHEEAARAIDAVREASNFSLTDFEAAANATRLYSMGLATSAEEAAKLTKISTTLGAAMGRDVTTSFEDFTLLLANQSLLRLDTFGISAAGVKIRMEELKDTMQDADRQTLFLTATMQIAEESMLKLDKAGFQATSNIDRMNATIRAGKEGLAEWLADGLMPIIDGAFALSDALKAKNEELVKSTDNYDDYLKVIADTENTTAKTAMMFGLLSENEYEAAKAANVLTEAQANQVEMAEEVFIVTEEWLDSLGRAPLTVDMVSKAVNGKIGPAWEKMTDLAFENSDAHADLLEKYQRFIDAGVDPADERIQNLLEGYTDLNEAAQDAARNLQELTTQMIYNQVAARLDAEGQLHLARSLGILDEKTFDVLWATEDLFQKYDAMDGVLDGVITDTAGFAHEARLLADAINTVPDYQGTHIEVSSSFDSTGFDMATQAYWQLPTHGGWPGTRYQHGGSFTIDGPPGPDRIPVMFWGTRGEEVSISPPTGPISGPAESGGGPMIGTVNIYNKTDLAGLRHELRNR